MSKADLKLDWCTHKAAKYACENWHYSKSLPVGKMVKVGVWEGAEFSGVILFAWGMNKSLGSPYGLAMNQCCELVRIALRPHKYAVTRAVAMAIKFLKKQSPGLRLVVSFADPSAGHHGGIYQGGNWVYAGQSMPVHEWRLGEQRLNRRAYTGHNFGSPKAAIPFGAIKTKVPGKHRYLMPLDDDMRRQIEPLRKPYPKRAGSADSGTPSHQLGGGGATPTPALISTGGENVQPQP